MCYHTEFGRFGQVHERTLRRSAGKMGPSWSRLSRSFDIIGTHRDRLAACDFLLLICIVTMGLYRFRDRPNERFWPKIVNLSHVLILTAPLTRFSLEFCNGNWAQKLEWCSYQTVKKCDNMCIHYFIYTQHRQWTDGRTDRQTDRLTDGQKW